LVSTESERGTMPLFKDLPMVSVPKYQLFRRAQKLFFTQMELGRSFAKPYIAVIAILVVNTMKVGGVKTFATGVRDLPLTI